MGMWILTWEVGSRWGRLTWAHIFLLLYIRYTEASQVHGRHAEGELANGPPLSQPIGEPGQMTVTVQVVGVETPWRRREREMPLHREESGPDL